MDDSQKAAAALDKSLKESLEVRERYFNSMISGSNVDSNETKQPLP